MLWVLLHVGRLPSSCFCPRYRLSMRVAHSHCQNNGRNDPLDPECQSDGKDAFNVDMVVRKDED